MSARASRKKFFFSKLAVLIFLWKGVSARASRKKQFGSSSEAIGKQFGSSSEAGRLARVEACVGGGLRGWRLAWVVALKNDQAQALMGPYDF